MPDPKIVAGDKEVDGIKATFDAFEKGVCFADESAQTRSDHAKEAFGMVGLAFFLAAEAVGACRERSFVGQPIVAAGGPRRR